MTLGEALELHDLVYFMAGPQKGTPKALRRGTNSPLIRPNRGNYMTNSPQRVMCHCRFERKRNSGHCLDVHVVDYVNKTWLQADVDWD